MSELFDILNDLSNKKEYLIKEDEGLLSNYSPFVINRFLSQHIDSLLYANDMNFHHHLDKKMQYDFFFNSLRKRFRKNSKWDKPIELADLQAVKEYFNYSDKKAKEALDISTNIDLKYLYSTLGFSIGGFTDETKIHFALSVITKKLNFTIGTNHLSEFFKDDKKSMSGYITLSTGF